MYHGERFNSFSHLLGTALAIVGLTVLVTRAASTGDPWKTVSFSLYGATLVALYLISTLYHCTKGRAKNILQKFDHSAIYLLIAGSYTPFTLVTLRGAWGWTLFGLSWGLALFGIVQELTLGRRTRVLSMVLYGVMGWMVLIAIVPLMHALERGGLFWLSLGGVLYSVGIYWFLNDEKIRHGHGIWHLFVLGGSVSQYICILAYVA